MAEKSAHLTQTTQLRPSIFDFVAQETLNDLLHPSAKKIIEVLALRNASFINILKWFDEYFFISHFLLQYYYLKKYGATFSEKFYGLQRVPVTNATKTNLLGRKHLICSLLAICLFPYVRSKLNKTVEKILLDILPTTTQRSKIIMLKSLIHCNSGLNICYQLLKFVQYLRYISGKTDINSPLLWAAGVKLKYADESFEDSVWNFRNFIPQLLQRSLEFGAFFIQFFQYWQTEKGGSFNVVPVPPPPQKHAEAIKYEDKCPICLKKREVDTVLSTSGFVFCFRCITAYLMEHNQCPVTKLPATVNNLIRIYSTS